MLDYIVLWQSSCVGKEKSYGILGSSIFAEISNKRYPDIMLDI